MPCQHQELRLSCACNSIEVLAVGVQEDAEQPGGSGRAQDEKMEMEVTFTTGPGEPGLAPAGRQAREGGAQGRDRVGGVHAAA